MADLPRSLKSRASDRTATGGGTPQRVAEDPQKVVDHTMSCALGMPAVSEDWRKVERREWQFLEQQCSQNVTTEQDLLFLNRTGRLDLLELCCAEDSTLGAAFVARGGKIARCGLYNGYDLSTNTGLERAKHLLYQHRPVRVHASPPCTYDTTIQNANMNTETQVKQLLKGRRWAKRVIKNVLLLLEIAKSLGSKVSFEHPLTALSWRRIPELFKFQKDHFEAAVYGCAWGLRDPITGVLIKKGWRFVTNDIHLKNAIARSCSGDHRHAPVQGRNSDFSARYPPQLCKKIAEITMRPPRAGTAAAVLAEQRANMEFTGDLPGERVLFSRAVDEAVELLEEFVFVSHPVPVLALNEKGRSDIGSDEISAEELRDVDRALRHLHANLGHPGNRALASVLKHGAATDWVIKRALELKCDACERFKRRAPTPVASTSVAEPMDVLNIDGIDWVHPMDRRRLRATLMVDEGSSKAVGKVHVVVNSKEQTGNTTVDEAWNTLLHCWFPYFGKPLLVRSDPEGAYRSPELHARAARISMLWENAPSQAHWCSGKIERIVALIKNTMSKLAVDDPTLTPEELLSLSCTAHNELHREAGWSPDQILLGRDRRPLDSDLVDTSILQDQAEATQGVDPTSLVQRRMKAKTSYLRVQAARRERVARLSARRAQTQWTRGELVVYWREPGTQHKDILKISKGGFVGPAVVLGQDQKFVDGQNQPRNRVWLLHGQQIITVAPAHLRAATDRQKMLIHLKDQDWPAMEDLLNKQGKRYLDLSGARVPTPEDLERLYDGLVPEQDEERLPDHSDVPPDYFDVPPAEVPDTDVVMPDLPDAGRAPAHEPEGALSPVEQAPSDDDIAPTTPVTRGPRAPQSPYEPAGEPENDDFRRDLTDAMERLIGTPTPLPTPDAVRLDAQDTPVGTPPARPSTPAAEDPPSPTLPLPLPGPLPPANRDYHDPRFHDLPVPMRVPDHLPPPPPPVEPTWRPIPLPPRSPLAATEDPAVKRVRIGYVSRRRQGQATSLFAAISELPDEASVVELTLDFEEAELWSLAEDPQIFLSQAAIKKRAEVSMRNATPELKEAMKEAKFAEIQTWLANDVCTPIARNKLSKPTMKLRWILTLKKDTGKAKARLVALGFQDADLGQVRTESPTASRRARSIWIQKTVNQRWKMSKADAKGAFLQGRMLDREVAVEPVPELREAFRLQEDEVLLLTKAVYGLVDAPREWWLCLDAHFQENGWMVLGTEPCCW